MVHRDYRIAGRGVEIFLYDDRLEVSSPGGLLPEVSLADLLTRKRTHLSRNPLIVRVLAELGLMREQGEGIPRMIGAMEESWLPLPELRSDASTFAVILRNTPVLDAGDPAWAATVRNLGINTRQKRVLVLAKEGVFTSAEYQRLNQVDRDTACKEVKQLVQMGLVAPPERHGRGARYRVVATSASTPAERIKLRMKEKGYIANADWRELLGVGRSNAAEALRALERSGVLRAEGIGRSRRYFPGSGWASWAGPN